MTDMKRLTTDDTESILLGLNLFFVKDNEVWIRGGGPDPDYQDCTLTDWINRAAAAQGIELDADDAEALGDVMYDCLQYGVDATDGILALLHAAAVQAAEMRGRLASIEDILGNEYDLDHLRELVEEEARLRDLETTHRTEMCEDGYDCVELGKARMALRGAVARAVKAEADFAEARKYICTICVERSCRGEDCRWFSWKDKGAK